MTEIINGVLYTEIKSFSKVLELKVTFDASGIVEPSLYNWGKCKNVYYPIIIK